MAFDKLWDEVGSYLKVAIPDLFNPITSLIYRIYKVSSAGANGNTVKGSLTKLSQPARVEPFTIISSDLMVGQDYMHDVLDTVLSIFSAYYLQAIALDAEVGGVKVAKYLDKFSPSRSADGTDIVDEAITAGADTAVQLGLINPQEAIGNLVGKESYVGVESYGSYSVSEFEVNPPFLNTSNYYFSLPSFNDKITLEAAGGNLLSEKLLRERLEAAAKSPRIPPAVSEAQLKAAENDVGTGVRYFEKRKIDADNARQEADLARQKADDIKQTYDAARKLVDDDRANLIASNGTITPQEERALNERYKAIDDVYKKDLDTANKFADDKTKIANKKAAELARNEKAVKIQEDKYRELHKLAGEDAKERAKKDYEVAREFDKRAREQAAKNTYDQKIIDDKAISEIKDSSNQAVGKILNVTITLQGKRLTVPVTVRLIAVPATPERIGSIMAGKKMEQDFASRWKRWRAGRIEFFKDLILCQDLIDEHKKRLMEDDGGVLMAIEERKSALTKASLANEELSIADATNIFIISTEVEKIIEKTLGGKLKSVSVRNKIFAQTYGMIIVVIDKAYERLVIYTRGIALPSTFSFREIKNKVKGANDGGVMDLLRQLSQGNAPQF